MRNVLITQNLHDENLETLVAQFPEFHFEMLPPNARPTDEQLAGAEVLMGFVNPDILRRAKNVKFVHSVSAGVDHFLPEAMRLFGPDLPVSNSAGVYGIPIAEHLLALMLAIPHRIAESVRNMPTGKWGAPRCREFHGSTVGIVGYGDIGSHLAALLPPFGCTVLGYKRTPVKPPANVDEMLYGEDGLNELVRRSDYVVICLPGSPQTKGLFDRARLTRMKPGAVLINIGRGYILDHDALADLLAEGHLGGAGLDVTEPEPLPAEHPLWRQPTCIITPHISGPTAPHWERRLAEFFALNLRAYAAGEPLPGAVDKINLY